MSMKPIGRMSGLAGYPAGARGPCNPGRSGADACGPNGEWLIPEAAPQVAVFKPGVNYATLPLIGSKPCAKDSDLIDSRCRYGFAVGGWSKYPNGKLGTYPDKNNLAPGWTFDQAVQANMALIDYMDNVAKTEFDPKQQQALANAAFIEIIEAHVPGSSANLVSLPSISTGGSYATAKVSDQTITELLQYQAALQAGAPKLANPPQGATPWSPPQPDAIPGGPGTASLPSGPGTEFGPLDPNHQATGDDTLFGMPATTVYMLGGVAAVAVLAAILLLTEPKKA